MQKRVAKKMIVVKKLCKDYGALKAVNNINFCISKGEVVSLLGPNGAGKTTLMRLITGYIEPTSGEVDIFEKDIRTNRLECLKKIGYVPESGFLYNEMTSFEFIKYSAALRGFDGTVFVDNLREVVVNLDLDSVINQKIENLSKGFKRRVGIAAALIHKPEILILDEPTEGLDPNQKVSIRRFIRDYGKNHIIIVSTHIMEEVEALSNRVILLNRGKLVKDTTPEELKKLFPENNIETAFFKITSENG